MTRHLLAFALGALLAPCAMAEEHHHDHGAGHTAAHGGCLNVIGGCENGHAEVKIDGTTLRLWFVGGGKDTAKAVRVSDPSITITTKAEDGQPVRTIVLAAKPLALAEEKIGDCSYFEGQADWLKGLTDLEANGSVTFKGAKTTFMIDWPHGYDPDHDDCDCDNDKKDDKKADKKADAPAH